ncbi:DUF6461 domain-containing protein [Kitasatospora sp. NPDC047058]|uniref:DUF6461 domain-containing protein n=1 Tax=Kitasatospora sp. NPDC047058 TaxID=3155620 RepID=UPI00340C516C
MTSTTDGMTWLAAPQSIAFGGYSVVLARGLDAEELVARLNAAVYGRKRTVHPLGGLTGEEVLTELEDTYGDVFDGIALRYGQHGDFVFAVMYGGWQGEFDDRLPVSRGDAHVHFVEFEEENGKPVPPFFEYHHDGRRMCAFNLHLDGSWGYTGVDGDPAVAARVQGLLAAAGLSEESVETVEDRDLHRACLAVLEQAFGLSLPRARILDEPLAAVVLDLT